MQDDDNPPAAENAPNMLFQLNYDAPPKGQHAYNKALRMSTFATDHNFEHWPAVGPGPGDTPHQFKKGEFPDGGDGNVFEQNSYCPRTWRADHGFGASDNDIPVIRVSSWTDKATAWNDQFGPNYCDYLMPASSSGKLCDMPVADAMNNRGNRALLILDVQGYSGQEAEEFDGDEAVAEAIYFKHVIISPNYNAGHTCRLFLEEAEVMG